MNIKNTTVQKWGNSLAIRIPAALAKKIHLHLESPIMLVVQDGDIILKVMGEPKVSLEERLKLFDPELHGGEVMVASERLGREKF